MTRVSAIVPPETPFDVTYSEAAGKTTSFHFEPRFLLDVVRRAGISPVKLRQVPPANFLSNHRVDYLCSLLLRDTERGEAMSQLYFESLATAHMTAVLSLTDAMHPSPAT